MENNLQFSTDIYSFRYEQLSRDIDKLEDIQEVKDVAKSFLKLYLTQQELLSSYGKL